MSAKVYERTWPFSPDWKEQFAIRDDGLLFYRMAPPWGYNGTPSPYTKWNRWNEIGHLPEGVTEDMFTAADVRPLTVGERCSDDIFYDSENY